VTNLTVPIAADAASQPIELGLHTGSTRRASLLTVLSIVCAGTLLVASAAGGNTGLWLGVIVLSAFSLGLALVVRLDLTHPWVWFLGPMALYSMAYPVLVLGRFAQPSTQLQPSIGLAFIAALAFAVATLPARGSAGVVRPFVPRDFLQGAALLMVPATILGGIGTWYIWQSGALTKYETALLESPLARLDFAYYWLITLGAFIAAGNLNRGQPVSRLLLTVLFGAAILALVGLGERDVLVRLGIVLGLLYVGAGAWKPSLSLILLLPLALALLTVLGRVKLLLVAGLNDFQVFGGWNLVTAIFGDELRTASHNTVTLMENVPQNYPFSYGKAILGDLRTAMVPGFLTGRTASTTTSSWFTETFYPGVFAIGGGEGFSLVGVGYLNFGIAGVAGVFAVIGAITTLLEKMGRRSAIGFALYVSAVPIFMASIRADLSVLASQLLKHVILPVLIVVVVCVVMRRVSKQAPKIRVLTRA
jgi:oligosaccharide repeat unit polymerase